MSKLEVDAITEQSGSTLTTGGGAGKTVVVDATTVTLGRCGGTVALAAGATQTGFGRTGTVDWDTTAKTGTFTGVSGKGYFINTTGSAFTVNLPASPSAGDIMAVKDYTGTFGSNGCTVGRNSSNIRSAASDFKLDTNNAGATFIYVDGTEGWQVFVDGSDEDAQANYIIATGGTITTSGNDKIHTFTGPGTFCVSQESDNAANNAVAYMVVAGGAGSGANSYSGGGGAGGFREGTTAPIVPYTASPIVAAAGLTVTVSPYTITVGAGGAAGPEKGASGSDSTFSTITSGGGGGGGAYSPAPPGQRPGGNGGSGGGGASNAGPAGAGNTPPVSPAQGFAGGVGTGSAGGGGGGATVVGSTGGPSGDGNPGGAGATTQIPSSPITKSTGGKGSGNLNPGVNGAANSGDGSSGMPATGGSGMVVIRYKYQ